MVGGGGPLREHHRSTRHHDQNQLHRVAELRKVASKGVQQRVPEDHEPHEADAVRDDHPSVEALALELEAESDVPAVEFGAGPHARQEEGVGDAEHHEGAREGEPVDEKRRARDVVGVSQRVGVGAVAGLVSVRVDPARDEEVRVGRIQVLLHRQTVGPDEPRDVRLVRVPDGARDVLQGLQFLAPLERVLLARAPRPVPDVHQRARGRAQQVLRVHPATNISNSPRVALELLRDDPARERELHRVQRRALGQHEVRPSPHSGSTRGGGRRGRGRARTPVTSRVSSASNAVVRTKKVNL